MNCTVNTFLDFTHLNGDSGEGHFQVVGLHTALYVRQRVVEVLLDLLRFLRLLQVWQLFVDLPDELRITDLHA